MFITSSRHKRDELGRKDRGLSGLGVVVTQTTRFDPLRMKARYNHYYNLFYNKVLDMLAQQYRDSGFEGLGQEPERLQIKAIDEWRGIREIDRSGEQTAMPEMEMPKPDLIKTLAVTGATAAIAIANPLLGIGMLATQFITPFVAKVPVLGDVMKAASFVFSGFGLFSKKPKIPWDKIRQQAHDIADPAARKAAEDEERYRLREEKAVTEEVLVKAVEKESQRAALFKLPEYTTGIRRGALVMELKGKPIEVRPEDLKKAVATVAKKGV